MKFFNLIALYFILGNVFAQSTHITVSGSVDKKPATLVQLKIYDDYLTPVTHTVGFCETDENKEFIIDFSAVKINQYQLIIGNQMSILHLTPGFSYSISIDSKFKIVTIESEDSINTVLSAIDNTVWDFKVKNKYKSIKSIKKLETSLEDYISGPKASDYVKGYYKYSVGGVYTDFYIKTLSDTLESNNLARRLLFESPILFENPAYFEFIEHHYYLNFVNFSYKYTDRKMDDDPYEMYLNQLNSIKNDTVQQIAILSASNEAFTSNWGKNQSRINQVVDSIKEASVHKSIESMAVNLINKYGHSLAGESVNDFTLYKPDSEPVQLSDYFGKYLLLDFWFTGCSPCIEAMPLKKKLHDKYSDKLEILSIDPQDNIERLQRWVNKKPKFKWTFLSAYKNRELIDYFQIGYYPRYFLIDPRGEIIYVSKEFKFENIYEEIEEIIK